MAATAKLAPHKNRWVRILSVAFVMYVLSYIDRTNIAMAIPAMRTELGISASAIGFATGMFFWGYIILQIPAGRLASVWSAKWVILGLLLFWSVVSFSTAFVRTENQLIANRFILGLFEGGVLTCTIVLIRKWFTRAERARANTLFLISIPIASVVANPISGVVLAHFGWQMMFIVEALPGLVWALVWIWAITEEPRDATWLDPDGTDLGATNIDFDGNIMSAGTAHALLWETPVREQVSPTRYVAYDQQALTLDEATAKNVTFNMAAGVVGGEISDESWSFRRWPLSELGAV